MILLQQLDHLVLTVADIQQSCEFYSKALGCQIIHFKAANGQKRVAIRIGNSPQKINLHSQDEPFPPVAKSPHPGSADLCFITPTPIDAVISHLQHLQISIVEGPIQRTGTLGPILSVYIRDPDGNLIEIATALYDD